MNIRPFRINVPEQDLEDLSRRLDSVRWPHEMPGVGADFGVPLDHVRRIRDHWRGTYDWRATEAELNSHPHFLADIDGQQIHFFHIRCPRPDALPLLLSHGWPGSVFEFLDVLAPLSRDFHLVVPELPGWGFSGPTTDRGWDVDRVARAWAELMRALGYDRYGVHGGDWGAGVSRALSEHDAAHVVAVHLSYLPTPPPADVEIDLNDDDRARLDQVRAYLGAQPGVRVLNGSRPQTPAYALNDSPVGLLAWILDVLEMWVGSDFAISDDRILDIVMLYWLTGTAGSAPRLHRESGAPGRWRTVQPVGVLVMPEDITRPVRAIAERSLPIVHWTEAPRGGHFVGLEAPDVLVEDLRAFFRRR